jgi:Haloacid dehalogenase-like hydrolase
VIEAVIFDIDGTIVDSVALHAKAWQRTFAKFGKNILLEAIRSQIGKGADQLLPVYFSKQELEQFGEAMEIYRGELFKKEYLPKVKGFPKVRELGGTMKKILPESGSCKFDIQRPNIILSQPTTERGSIVIQHRSQGSNPITFHEHSIWTAVSRSRDRCHRRRLPRRLPG